MPRGVLVLILSAALAATAWRFWHERRYAPCRRTRDCLFLVFAYTLIDKLHRPAGWFSSSAASFNGCC